MENTESYLNLNSDQFNSWLSDFESEFKKLEKDNTSSSSDNHFYEDNKSLNESVEIECSSDSEEMETSNVFIQDNNCKKKNRLNLSDSNSDECTINSTTNNSSHKRRLFSYTRRRNCDSDINKSFQSSDQVKESCSIESKKKKTKKKSKSRKKQIDHVKKESIDHVKKESIDHIRKESIDHVKKEPLLTVTQINSIIPKFNDIKSNKKHNHISSSDHNVEDNIKIKKEINVKKNIKLGSQALYRFIKYRRS